MKFNEEAHSYLNGDKFSNGKVFRFLPARDTSVRRLDLLESLSVDKDIIHIGFTDHIPLIEKKMEKNIWLHARLVKSARSCVGIDIDNDAVSFVKEKLQIPNVYTLDIVEDEVPAYLEGTWDYMILGEVLEHIDNPVSFLTSIRNKYKGKVKQMVITVPNALDIHNISATFKSTEFINTDHRYWFTPFTLGKVITRAGFTMDRFQFCQSYTPAKRWQRFMVDRFPGFRETVAMVINF